MAKYNRDEYQLFKYPNGITLIYSDRAWEHHFKGNMKVCSDRDKAYWRGVAVGAVSAVIMLALLGRI